MQVANKHLKSYVLTAKNREKSRFFFVLSEVNSENFVNLSQKMTISRKGIDKRFFAGYNRPTSYISVTYLIVLFLLDS